MKIRLAKENKQKRTMVSPQITRKMPIVGADGITGNGIISSGRAGLEAAKRNTYKYWLTYGDWLGSKTIFQLDGPMDEPSFRNLVEVNKWLKDKKIFLQENITGFRTLSETLKKAEDYEEQRLRDSSSEPEVTQIIKLGASKSSKESYEVNGDCFRQAWKTFYNNLDKDPLLVHGVITGQGAIEGIQYVHAWIEIGDMVIDTTISLFKNGFPRDAYYGLARADESRVFKYDRFQVSDKAMEYQTYGPWESELEQVFIDLENNKN